MRRLALLSAIALLAACSQEAEAPVESEVRPDSDTVSPRDQSLADPTVEGPTRQAGIPARFQGVWDHVDGRCNPSSDLRVEVSSDALGFYEAQGRVLSVSQVDPDTIDVELEVEGGGEVWTMVRRFRLSRNGETMTPLPVESEGEFEPMPLKRCTT